MPKKPTKISAKQKSSPKITKAEKTKKIITTKAGKNDTKPVAVPPEKDAEEKDEHIPLSKDVEKALEEVDEKIDDPEAPVTDEILDVMTEEDFSPDIDDADEKEEW